MDKPPFIAWGMYTQNESLRSAWQLLFDRFCRQLDERIDRRLRFDSDDAVLRDPKLYFGHTCGYPLVTRLQDVLHPFCVPEFDLPGTEGRLYSSFFAVPLNSGIETLEQCRGKVLALNHVDSNSGMNVLRHALASIGAAPGFFGRVELTGGHADSLRAVAEDRAQLAAIDCVSFRLAADEQPGLEQAVRIIGRSEATCGLPLVAPLTRYSDERRETWIGALNEALAYLPRESADRLHLRRFSATSMADYERIAELERIAVDAGYPALN